MDGAIVGIGVAALPVAVGLTILVILAAIPLVLWLTTKLLLVPAAIMLEHATIRGAIGALVDPHPRSLLARARRDRRSSR